MTPEQLVAYRRRARQPTAAEARHGVTVRTTRPMPARRDYAAPSYDPTRNARANGANRSYSYMTAQDVWAARKGEL